MITRRASRKTAGIGINGGYQIVSFVVMSAIPGAWQSVFKNSSRRRKEADFGAENTSASLPRRLRLLRRFLNSPSASCGERWNLLSDAHEME
jgi:hypothetical protein